MADRGFGWAEVDAASQGVSEFLTQPTWPGRDSQAGGRRRCRDSSQSRQYAPALPVAQMRSQSHFHEIVQLRRAQLLAARVGAFAEQAPQLIQLSWRQAAGSADMWSVCQAGQPEFAAAARPALNRSWAVADHGSGDARASGVAQQQQRMQSVHEHGFARTASSVAQRALQGLGAAR